MNKDCVEINNCIKKNGYHLWKVDDNFYEITKNEHGICGEKYDFKILFTLNLDETKIYNWKIIYNDILTEQKKKEKIISEFIDSNKDLFFDNLCIQLSLQLNKLLQ